MRKIALSIILVVVLIGISGCANKSQSQNNTTQNSITSTTQNTVTSNIQSNKNGNTVKEIDSPKVNNDKSDTITDIASWNHPVKYVFKNANITVQKVEFEDNNAYPIFYVSLSKNLDENNKIYYKNLVQQVATANGYWDYEIIDQAKNVDIKVSCDRLNRNVEKITNNGDNTYFANIIEQQVESTDDQIVNYLIDNVSEVKSFMQSFQNNESGIKGITYVEREPDPNSNDEYLKNYYGIYVGESHPDHNVNIYRFAINKDTKEILYYDVVSDKYQSLSDWRASN